MRKPLFPDALKQLLEEFSRSGVRELHVRTTDFELYLSTDPTAGRNAALAAAPKAPSPQVIAPPAPAPLAPAAQQAPKSAPVSALPSDAIIITAPNLGTFYRAPKPGAANYVEVGARVKAGDELCLIEVMKLFTSLKAAEDGVIHSVLVEDGAMVEGGQPLFALVKN